MQTNSIKFYNLNYSDAKTYLLAALFVIGNILAPQLCHLMHQGGVIWLPIYFFTLIGAYKYGWKVGLLTALVSPTINSLLFGMPAMAVLPVIIIKSVVLALTAGLLASRFRSAALWQLLVVVLTYQIIGSMGEWILCGSLSTALQDFRIGLPGMLVQIIGGHLVLTRLFRQ